MKAPLASVLFLTLAFLPLSRARAAMAPEDADAFYQQGNCQKALPAYQALQKDGGASASLHELALFRASYCLLQTSRPAEAAESFAAFLKLHPDHDEARLRYAQALFQAKNAAQARDNALRVKDGPFRAEAVLTAAQAELELGRFNEALERLSATKVSDDWKPAYAYWIGVAKYRKFDLKAARAAFLYADSISPNGHWVKQETMGWLDRIHQDERPWHGSAVLGYLSDSNVAQESIVLTDTAGNPTQSAPYAPSYYSDTGFYVGAELDYRLYQTDRWTLSAFATGSSSYYQTYSSYDFQSLAAGLVGSYRPASNLTVGLTAKFLDTRYHNLYYQNYGSLDPNVTYGVTDRFFLYAEMPVTWYFPTRHYTTFGVALSGRYLFDGWRLFGGGGYTKASGAAATFYSSSGFSFVNTGEMFVNYSSYSKYLGATVDLPWSLYTTLQLTSTAINYAAENVTTGTVQVGANPRQDTQWLYGAELGRIMIPNLWTLALSYNYTHNTSSGQQGVVYNSEQTNYNYNRNYWMLKTTISF